MKNSLLYIALSLLIFSCANGQDHTIVKVPAAKPGQQVATFAGGCFWAMSEAMSELKGVDQVVSGYAGGDTKNPTYEEVCTRTTNHAETVQIYYNPKVISYAKLAEAFFYAHDPTTLNRQGPDEGTDYRSVVFYRTPEEKTILLNTIKSINATKHYKDPIVTQVVPYTVFYAAEKYHQGYYRIHPESGYIQGVSVPKVMKMRKAMKDWLKPEFK
jgi:peptide-methionine (S)-S-oxide reductase